MNAGSLIPAQRVCEIHDLILTEEPGLAGQREEDRLFGALARVESTVEYEGVDDVFEIAGLYAMALARGHAFNDCNKRTALVTSLTYLALQGIEVPRYPVLEEMMVQVAQGGIGYKEVAEILFALWDQTSAASWDEIP